MTDSHETMTDSHETMTNSHDTKPTIFETNWRICNGGIVRLIDQQDFDVTEEGGIIFTKDDIERAYNLLKDTRLFALEIRPKDIARRKLKRKKEEEKN